jgi:hypothetical protein
MIMSLVAFSGCKSGMFKSPDLSSLKRPDFSSLAFWKKDQSEIPPPPAHHFDPAPATGKVAESESSDIQTKFNAMVREARDQQEKHKANPITNSYDLGEVDGKNLSNRNSSESKNDAKAVSYVPELDSTIKQAQQDFSSAIANTKKSVSDSVTASAGAADKWKNDFQLPGKIAAAQKAAAAAKNDFNMTLDDANRSLQARAAQGQQMLSNSLQPNLNAVTNVTNEMLGKTVGMATQAAKSVKDSSTQEMGKVQAEVALAQQQIAELKRQVAEAKQQALVLASNPASQAAPPVSQLAARPIEHVANLNLPATNYGSAGQNQLQPNQLQPQSSSINPTGNFSPLNNSSPSNGLYPSNVLRSDSFVPAGSSSNGQLQPQSTNEQPVNQYPSTPHSSYSSQILVPQNVQPVSAQTTGSASGFADGSQVISADFAQESGEQSHVSAAGHISDVEIPKAILQGSGSFAPGSVTPLTPR